METMSFSDAVELFKAVRKRQEGQTMAEYAVVLGVITLTVVAVFSSLSNGIKSALNSVKATL